MTSPASSKVVWITGASGGIGAAIAEVMARSGNTVAVSARSADKLSLLAEKYCGKGRIVSYPLDVTDEAAQRQVIERIQSDLGSIDVAVLNAGTYYPDQGLSLDTTTIRKQFDLNVFSVMTAISVLIPSMRQQTGAQIAIVSSVAGYRGLPHAIGYGGTKAALINMAEALKLDCDAIGIKLQLICPGFVKTPLTDKNEFPMPFLVDVDQAARIIVKGLATNKFEIVFPRPMALIMKILRFLPDVLYFWLIKQGTGVGKK